MTAATALYPAPSEARAKRSGGRGFYADRGRAYPRKAFEERDQHRTPEEREAAELGRDLAELAERFPRFRTSLNRVRHHVLIQVRSPKWKRQVVLNCLGEEPISQEELVDETDLDVVSVEQTLSVLEQDHLAEKCTRSGGKAAFRRDGKPVEKIYWRRRGS